MLAFPIEFSSISGTVLDVERGVAVPGEGGWAHPQHGGTIRSSHNHTRPEEIKRARIRWEGGRQQNIVLPVNIGVSVGDEVSAIVANEKNVHDGHFVGFVNHTVKEGFRLPEAHKSATEKAENITLFFMLLSFGGAALSLVMMFFREEFASACLFVSILSIVAYFYSSSILKKMKKRFYDDLNQYMSRHLHK